ncbi:MAG: hypothetical protein ACRDH0_08195 [Actinomycetota bacterium]
MADPNWERYAAGTGLGAAVLLWVQAFVAPLYPGFDDAPLEVARYYQSNAAAIRVQMLLTGLAGILFLWFLGSLRAHLRRAEGDTGRVSAVAFGAGIAALGPASVGVISTATAAHIAGSGLPVSAMTGPREAQLLAGLIAVAPLNDMRLLAYALGWFALAPLLAATAVVTARTGVFPRWHMNASYALFLLSFVAALSVLLDSGPFAPGGAYNLVLFGLFVLWLGTTSWLMTWPPTAAAREPEETAELEPPPAA